VELSVIHSMHFCLKLVVRDSNAYRGQVNNMSEMFEDLKDNWHDGNIARKRVISEQVREGGKGSCCSTPWSLRISPIFLGL